MKLSLKFPHLLSNRQMIKEVNLPLIIQVIISNKYL